MDRERILQSVPELTDSGLTWDKPEKPKKRTPFLVRVFTFLVSIAVIVILPFALLLRVSTYAYVAQGVQTWVALLAGVFATALVVTIYAAIVSKKLTGKARVRLLAKRVALPLVLVYCAYTLLYLSSVNAKSEDVREYYRSLHPMLRIAVSTVILVDRDIVITDTHRNPEDYAAMGLPIARESMHYRQDDGYVHAMDLRTIGRPEWKNSAIQAYFNIIGMETLRHEGSADHLHVSIPLR